MRQERMSVTQALSELKMLGKRIDSAISNGLFIAVRIPAASMTVEEVTERIKASDTSVRDLIARRNAIKSALVMSNAMTKLTIAGKEYTVTQAIDAKKYAMEYQAQYVSILSAQLKAAHKEYDTRIAAVERNAMEITQKTVQNSGAPVSGEDLRDLATYKNYIEINKVTMIDPLGVANMAKAMTDEINQFLLEVDTALSISNATTFIDVSYGEGCDCSCHEGEGE